MRRAWLLPLVLAGCKKKEEGPPIDTAIAPEQVTNDYPLPEDLDTIDFVTAFQDGMRLMATVTTQQPWRGHSASLDTRRAGCPDFWTGEFTDAGITVSHDYGVAWNDDCATEAGLYYDGWIWWDFGVSEGGDPDSSEGRIAEADRTIEGNGVVGNDGGVRFEFDGEATDTLYQLEANGFSSFVYSTRMDATVTGSDIFDGESLTPNGFRTELYMRATGGDVETFEAKGDVYLFTPQLHGRFDSVGVDMLLAGARGAAPTDCTQEPLGWVGLRDENAYWYQVVFLPRTQESIIEEDYPNDPLSRCDGCGRLYVGGVDQEIDVCVDFSFLFDEFGLPNPDDYVLPLHSL